MAAMALNLTEIRLLVVWPIAAWQSFAAWAHQTKRPHLSRWGRLYMAAAVFQWSVRIVSWVLNSSDFECRLNTHLLQRQKGFL